MKEGALKFILLVIIPVVILIGVGIYYVLQIPQVRYGIPKSIMNLAIARSVRKGEISQETAGELKKAFNRLFEVSIEVEKKEADGQIDEEELDKEIEAWAGGREFSGPHFGLPNNEEEAKEVVNVLNGIADIMEKHLEKSAAKTK